MKALKAVTLLMFALILTLVVYWKIPLKGLIPFPGNLLVGRFFPFNTMTWEGYPLGVPYKEFINADVIRQQFPWRDMAVKQLKSGQMPWWNPYAFAGNPLLANVQSASFYPMNFIYWLTSHQNAWLIQVVLQPVLAMVFMWLFVRELGLSKAASVLSAISFSFMGYMVIWWELNTVGHAALWLPLILLGIERWNKTKKHTSLLLLIAGVSASLLAGHLQTSIYVIAVAAAYYVFKALRKKEKWGPKFLPLIISLAVALIISSVQILPALDFTPLSPRGTQADPEVFERFLLPPENLVTFFAPDFFGNPAVKNFWGKDYGEFMGYLGVVALYFTFLPVFARKKKEVKFFMMLSAVALLFALKTPFAHLLRISKLPILSNSAPSRTLFIIEFAFAVLAGFGADQWLKGKAKVKVATALLAALYIVFWLIAGLGRWQAQDPGQMANWAVSLRNLILPTAVFSATAAIVFLSEKFKFTVRLRQLAFVALIGFALVEYSYFANKFQTFSPKEFFFPQSPIYTFMYEQSKNTPDRFFGDYTASVTSNTWIPFKVYGVEGYDSLYIKRFGELLAASQDGLLPTSVPRSDANLVKNQDDLRRRRLQDLMGVRFILDKNDNPQSDWEPDPHRFPPQRYQLIWQEGKFKIYENTQALPRAFLVGEAIVENDPQTIVDLLFNPDFDLSEVVIVEEEIPVNIQESDGSVKFVHYEPNTVELEVETPNPQLLFLSDAYYPDWKASIDGKETKIYRANFAFRAILVPQGRSQVRFFYESSFL